MGGRRLFSWGWLTCIIWCRISVALSMVVNVAWKWRAGAYPRRTGCSTCKSSPREGISAFLNLPTTKCDGMCASLCPLRNFFHHFEKNNEFYFFMHSVYALFISVERRRGRAVRHAWPSRDILQQHERRDERRATNQFLRREEALWQPNALCTSSAQGPLVNRLLGSS